MTTYRNDVTYTTWSEAMRINIEQTAVLDRPRRLTRLGAERILRAAGRPTAKVVSVSSCAYEVSR